MTCTSAIQEYFKRQPVERLFIFFTLVNIINYVDRGIVPGAPDEFDAFITSTTGNDKPNALLGMLNSTYIVGIASASIIFGNLTHRIEPFRVRGPAIARPRPRPRRRSLRPPPRRSA